MREKYFFSLFVSPRKEKSLAIRTLFDISMTRDSMIAQKNFIFRSFVLLVLCLLKCENYKIEKFLRTFYQNHPEYLRSIQKCFVGLIQVLIIEFYAKINSLFFTHKKHKNNLLILAASLEFRLQLFFTL